MMKRFIGVCGGTFDPVHLGHISAAKELQKALDMDELRLVLSARPPHRKTPMLSAEQRFSLLKLAVIDESNLIADDSEMLRPGPSYMVDTLAGLRKKNPQTAIALILGMEAFNSIMHWYQWERLLEMAHIVITDRAGFNNQLTDELKEFVLAHQVGDKRQLKEAAHGKIFRQNVTPIDISATQIRRLLQQGEPVKRFLSAAVCAEIQNSNMYAPVN